MSKSTVQPDDTEPDLSRALQVLVEEKTAAITERAIRGSEQLDAEDSLTYHVRLVLDNDETLYNTRREIIREHLAARDRCPMCGGVGTRTNRGEGPNARIACERCGQSGKVSRSPHQLGERLKGLCEELIGLEWEGDAGSGLAREVLSTALAWVDWAGLAASYIEDMSTELEAL